MPGTSGRSSWQSAVGIQPNAYERLSETRLMEGIAFTDRP
jgi:hypothetical protein